MTRLGKIEKAIEIVSEELHEQGNINTVVVGATGTGKDFSFIMPNILLEEKKNLIVIDPLDELTNLYAFKEKQGYRILKYTLEKEDVLQQVEIDLLNSIKEKVLIHATFPKTFGDNKERDSYLVLEFINKVKDAEWIIGKSLHLFLMEYEGYASAYFNNIFGAFPGYKISTTLGVKHVKSLENGILENCHYVLYKRLQDAEIAEWIAYKLKNYQVDFQSKILGTDLLFLPLTAEILMNLPLDTGLLHKRCGDFSYENHPWVKIVETYNTEEILGRYLYDKV
ncbi:type IV secretory system conjugative DNA transfer family protein [Bacillus thuringiensis]|uniref:type IV secretory system conjugative DNA transfer family protein n=1 Tax=Bacillus thuringiensis TaxID=1428 RepID=UPI002DC03296|nr:type IV secretory system conjugative DNA transfer family protein [Bacillus thuringiensis]MEC3226227.1 type IV secretory system conjugative DNA transfer family protein [Bacillus thuringiensis]MEC3463577.1 type IV secretory system conjugative DNA transfer family protein [Bacillus thuringiensis]MEC3556630.1 type IV secretory system conjugative DNA transfer family protein [Bacillus thuringiensis]MED2055678.1 type IV secretory system conjugative DNA transfer family protein [Bacillus thuringiensis